MAALAPNPSSPFADAYARRRHVFPTVAFFGDPRPGALALTGCDRYAVVPTEQLTAITPGSPWPEGLCTLCVGAMNGEPPRQPERPLTECRECGSETRHDGMCALCRMDAHDAWWAEQHAERTQAGPDAGSTP